MNDDKITVFLTDDHQLVIDGIIALVSQDPCIQVVGHCNNGVQVLDRVRQAMPDVLVLDISLPGMNGLDICQLVKAKVPQTNILMLTMHANERCILDAFQKGATGYLIKEAVGQEFCEAVHAVARGEVYLGHSLPRSLLDHVVKNKRDPLETLSDREHRVLQLTVEGYANRKIAAMLGVSKDVVEADFASLTSKLGFANDVELVKYAVRKHVAEPVESEHPG